MSTLFQQFGQSLSELPWRAVTTSASLGCQLFGSRHTHPLGILTYHRVIDRVPGMVFPEHNVSPERLGQQLEGMQARGYEFWSLKQLLSHASQPTELHDRIAIITFDDGYESVYLNAFPILKKLGIPATIFVATQFLDGTDPFPFDDWGTNFHHQLPQSCYGPLTSDQCHEMLDSQLIDLGAHTHTHQDFRGHPQQFRSDLAENVNILRERFGLGDVSFAFPYGCPYRGYASEALIEQAMLAGVTCSLTTEAIPVDVETDPFHWGRFNVFSWDNAASLAAKIEGWYEWAPRLRRRVFRTAHPSQAPDPKSGL